jgi:hypothetical protein
MCGHQGEENCLAYGPGALLLPIFRGLRVRVGIHTGVADVVEINPVTRRYTYGGRVAKIAKLVSDTPSGGQIVMSGDSLAQIRSVQDLMTRVCSCSPSRLPVALVAGAVECISLRLSLRRKKWRRVLAFISHRSLPIHITPVCRIRCLVNTLLITKKAVETISKGETYNELRGG